MASWYDSSSCAGSITRWARSDAAADLSVDHVHQRAAVFAKHHGRLERALAKVKVSREIENLELHQRVVVDFCGGRGACWWRVDGTAQDSTRAAARDAAACCLPLMRTSLVLSRKSVSCGDILWKTTFWMEDLPLLP
jgi:hypothetical protein